jgi:hypothetical protein
MLSISNPRSFHSLFRVLWSTSSQQFLSQVCSTRLNQEEVGTEGRKERRREGKKERRREGEGNKGEREERKEGEKERWRNKVNRKGGEKGGGPKYE